MAIKLIDFAEGEEIKASDYSLKTDYSIFEYPFPLSDGVIIFEEKPVGYFTRDIIQFFAPVYLAEFWECLIEDYIKGLEKRVLIVQTGNWGFDRVLSMIFAIVFKKYSWDDLLFINELLDFVEKGEGGAGDEEVDELMELHWKGILWTEKNKDFALKLLKLVRPLIDKEIRRWKGSKRK